MIAELRYYLMVFWRRLPLFLLVFVLIATSAIFAALTLPPIYRSQMRLVVESSQIPGRLAQSTVNVPAEEQLQLFETRLMTRDNLLAVANKLRPFPDQDAMTPDEVVTAMRGATSIFSSTGQNQATLMTLAFEARSPAVTAQVLDSYLTFLLAEDAQYRTERAGQTQAFFQQEVDRLSAVLSQQSARIVEFKNQNSDALPDGMEYRRGLLLNLQERIGQLERERSGLDEQKQRLTQVFEATGRVGLDTERLSPQEQYIQQMKTQLAELEAVYAPASPRIVTMKNRIAQLENNLAETSGQTTAPADPARAMFDLQMSEIDTKISQIDAERKRLDTQVGTIEDQINRTASNAIALESLQRDYDNAQEQYNRASDNLASASTGERIETLSRGQRVSVVERPTVPTSPVKPARKRIALMGVVGGLGVAGGLLLALEFLSGTIKRSKDLVNGLGIVPMVTIPFMRSRAEERRIRFQRIGLSLVIGLVVPFGLWLLHTYYMPFDEIASKVAARIGLRL